MNSVEAYPNVIGAGAECARYWVERAIEKIQAAFRGPGLARVHREVRGTTNLVDRQSRLELSHSLTSLLVLSSCSNPFV